MEETIFHHMSTVRNITEETLRKIPEEMADIVPRGYNNNIRWNFGHIAFVQEKIVFGLLGEEMKTPKEYATFFAAGTSPASWHDTPPTLIEISEVLSDQKIRLKESLIGRLQVKLPTPYTNKMGITFFTVGEAFLFSFYHEALHTETIKRLSRAISST